MTPKAADGISKLMQALGRRYVQYITTRYQRSGTLWEGRYKAVPMDSEGYVMTCYRYIEMNPVRAGMVTHPGGYRWSSYPGNADGTIDELLKPHALYRALGSDDTARRSAYRKLLRMKVEETELSELREAINKGWMLGSDRFKRKVEAVAQRRVAPLARGGKRQGAGRPKQVAGNE